MPRACADCSASNVTAAGIGARALRDHGHVVAFAPDLQLLDRGRAERVAGGEHHLAALGGVAVRELADRRGLAGAVDADDQDHERLVRRIDDERLRDGLQDLEHGRAQRGEQRVQVAEFLALHAAAQRAQDLLGGLDADVGGDQARLEFVEDVLVDLAAGQQVGEVVGEPGIAAVELGPHAGEPALPRRPAMSRPAGGGTAGAASSASGLSPSLVFFDRKPNRPMVLRRHPARQERRL